MIRKPPSGKPENSSESNESSTGVSAPVLVLATLLAVLGIRWTVDSIQVKDAGGIEYPLLVLLALVLLAPVLKRLFRFGRREILLVYCFTLVASGAYDGVSRFLPCYTVPTYFASPENRFAEAARAIPDWFAPKDPEVIRRMYEGADDGKVPWQAWRRPVGVWTGFFLILWVTLYCLTLIMRGHWIDTERLTFPLVQVPLYLTEAAGDRAGQPPLLRDPLLWVGFTLSFVHFASIMLHAANPNVPTLGTRFNIGDLFTEFPWSSLRPYWWVIYNPLLAGLAYFASQDLCLSMFFFFFLIKGVYVVYTLFGYRYPPGLPFFWEQSAGAFFALGLFYAWTARRHLRTAVRTAVGLEPDRQGYRLPVLGAMLGFLALCSWYVSAGMSWWVAGLFFGMVILFATVFTRGRAESGVPSLASFPFWQASRQLKNFLGSEPLLVNGSYANLTLLGSLIFLHFGLFPQTMTYQLETLKIARERGLSRRAVTGVVLAGMVVGLAVTFHAFLTLDYRYGANVLAGGTTSGGYHVSIALREYQAVGRIMSGTPLRPDWNRNGYTMGAFVLTLILVALRMRYLRFPLHPLGYVMTASYGYAYWFSFFVIWVVKGIILKVGGVRLYRRMLPLFLGLIIGQVFTLGFVWQGAALFADERWRRAADPLAYF